MKMLIAGAALLGLAIAVPHLGAEAQTAAPARKTIDAGDAIYRQKCQMCHGAPGTRGLMGPSLIGVVGRPAGTAPGFAYSNAMKSAALTWNAATLDRYLAKPTSLVPGSRMPVGLPNATERAAVINYLSQLR